MRRFNYYVYILKCSDKSYYTGVTNNLERRMHEHNSGVNIDSYTHNRRPVEIVFFEGFISINQAIEFEKKVKGWTRKKKEAIIENNWDKLQELSVCLNETSHVNFKKGLPFDSAQGDIKLSITFPVYRKYKNNKNFFKIISENEFDEISFVGTKVIVTNHLAKILPDRNLIADLLYDSNFAEPSSQEEYELYL